MSASDNKNLDILLAANADVLTDQDAEYLRQLDVSDVEISAETDKRITRMIKRKSWLEALHTPMLICKRIAAVFLIVCTIGFAVCMSVQEVRAYIVSMFTQWYDKYVSVYYVTEEIPPVVIEKYREPIIALDDLEKHVDAKVEPLYFIRYTKNNETVLIYSQTLITNSPSDKNSEDVEMKNVKVNKYDALLFIYDDGITTITWHDNQYAYSIYNYLDNISPDDLIQIAESVYADVGQTD